MESITRDTTAQAAVCRLPSGVMSFCTCLKRPSRAARARFARAGPPGRLRLGGPARRRARERSQRRKDPASGGDAFVVAGARLDVELGGQSPNSNPLRCR